MTQKKSLLENYANESSIHGVKHILGEKSHKLTKILWISAFFLSFFGLAYYSHGVYTKFQSKPDFGVKISQMPMSEIPFPAVTICSPIFSKNLTINSKELSDQVMNDNHSIPDDVLSIFIANLHLCDPKMLSTVKITNYDVDLVHAISESSIEPSQLFDFCSTSAANECHLILTTLGFCYTFNIQNYSTIYNADVISRDFYYKNHNKYTNWSIDKGYSVREKFNESIPYRALKKYEFQAQAVINKSISDNICPFFGKAFTFFMHSPSEIPTPFHKKFFVPFNNEKIATLTAKSFRTDDALRSYSADIRKCYFENEKKLKFFKSYTKAHCDFECVSNYTLEKCGCVKFSMPRDENTRVCGHKDVKCYIDAIENWPEDYHHDDVPCGCLPMCNYIEYSINYEMQASSKYILKFLNNKCQDCTITCLYLSFNDHVLIENETYVAYKIQNLIADLGGLLGLFLGCSLLSLIEIIYYLSMLFKENRKKNEEMKIDEFNDEKEET